MSADATTAAAKRRVALIGNPNTGKTTLFNALTGLSQRTGNYPGVTVETKTGAMDDSIELLDLPGAYSLAAHSPDEMVAVDVLLGRLQGEARPDLVVVILDAGNLQRNLYLASQIMETGLPVILALNMMDVAERVGVTIDADGLAGALGVPVVPTVATRADGRDAIRSAIENAGDLRPPEPSWRWPEALQAEFDALAGRFGANGFLLRRALIDEDGSAEQMLAAGHGEEFRTALAEARARIKEGGQSPAALEVRMRYGWIAKTIKPHVERRPAGPTATDRLDRVLTHRIFGTLVFALLMSGVFITIFKLALPVMGWANSLVGAIGDLVQSAFAGTAAEGGPVQSLLVEGVIAGVGAVIVFLPQIVFLFLFLAILEGCGYMARAAFLMDRLLRFCGLSGHSFVPMMSSFACAIPGVMAARTIANPRDRLTTILVAPLMSCSARIPVYAIMIAAFIPAQTVWGFLPLQGAVFAGMYFVGIFTAIPVAFLLKRTLLKGPTPPFVMELPPYRVPRAGTVLLRVYQSAKAFTLRAGTVIFVVSVIIWALGYFPRPAGIHAEYEAKRAEAARNLDGAERNERLAALQQEEDGTYSRQSALGRMGQFVAPLGWPLGWDWKITTAAIASFPAREVIVATLGIIYDLGGDVDVSEETGLTTMTTRLKGATWPDGRKVYTLPVALSIMVFFALCAQCGATLATIWRETKSIKWPLFTFTYMTVLAYVGALITYQVGTAVGL